MRKTGIGFLLVCCIASPAAAAGLELHVLDCGTLDMDAEPFLPGVADRPERLAMVNRCFLVVHPEGTLLWDAGLAVGFKARVLTWLAWIRSFGKLQFEPGPALVGQLEALGVSAADVDYLTLSHSHFDHVGQAADFAQATWLVQKTERDWVLSPGPDKFAVDASLVEPLRDSKTVELAGDHDVFGDGSVRILSAPGHTPGHQCLFLDLPETGPVVLSGDLYHSLLNRELRVAPSFNTDAAQTRESMERIEAFVEERGAQLWIQHASQSGPQAPAHLH